MDSLILAIETSCDETACAVVEDGKIVRSNAVFSQIELHKEYGGVVPEVASRNHALTLPHMIDSALAEASVSFFELSAVAVTNAPGLVGALLTGVSYAKALAYSINKPLIAVNHIAGHICANYLTHPTLTPPFLCLVVSGGHTHIVEVVDYLKFKLLGQTRDDAAGEAFDKIARVLGLGYPGGPLLEQLARQGKPIYPYPVSFKGEDHLDFSFSGLKTSVINHLRKLERGEGFSKADVAASFQENVVSTLLLNVERAVLNTGFHKIALAGGVSANGLLQERFVALAKKLGVQAYVPHVRYTTDNAAMIGAAAHHQFVVGDFAGLDTNALPRQSIF